MKINSDHTAYQDFVIVLPGVVNNLPQYFEDFCFGEKRTESNSQITINHSPVEHLQHMENRDAVCLFENILTFSESAPTLSWHQIQQTHLV